MTLKRGLCLCTVGKNRLKNAVTEEHTEKKEQKYKASDL